jgi:uncharacterized protein (TIRG00374 family)
VAVFFLLQQVSLEQLGHALAGAQPLPVLLIVLVVLVSVVARAARWQVFFLPHVQVPFTPLLETLTISYMASTFLPLRAGELVRAVFLAGRASVAISRVVGTIVLEKLFDFLAIGVMLLVLLVMGFTSGTPLPAAVQVAAGFIGTVILVGFAFVVALAIFRTPTLNLLRIVDAHLPTAIARRVKITPIAAQFAEGTDSLRSPRLWVWLLLWTTVTWLMSLLSIWAGVKAVNAEPTLPMVLFVSILTSTGQAVPSSPGYVGVYHAAATLALTLFGLDPASAIAVAVITHACSYGCLVVAGLIALWTGGYTFGDVISGVSGSKTATSPTVALAPES